MPSYRLNKRAFESAKALVRSGNYTDTAWGFTAADSNDMLGTPPNWTDFAGWHLGLKDGVADPVSDTGATPEKDWYAYPYGKTTLNLNALKTASRQAKTAGDLDVVRAADELVDSINTATADKAKAASLSPVTFTAPIDLKAAPAGPPTFDMEAYTGGPMRLDGWEFPVVVDLAGMDFTDKSRPILKSHDPDIELGHTTSITTDGKTLHVAGVISGAGPEVEKVKTAAKNGFPWQASIGAKVLSNQFVPKGQTADANGKTWPGPVNIARRSSLREISILSLGADDNTSTRIAAQSAKGNAMKFKAWMKARGFTAANIAEMSADQVKCAKAMYAAMVKDGNPDDDSDDDPKEGKGAAEGLDIAAGAATDTTVTNTTTTATADLRASMTAERKRFSDVAAKLDEYKPRFSDPAKFTAIEAKALGGEWGIDKIELELVKGARPEITAANINTGTGGALDGQIIAAACSMSVGIKQEIACKGLDERAANIACSSPHLRGMTLHKIIDLSARQIGMHVAAGSIDDSFIEEFLIRDKASHRQQLNAQRSLGITAASGGLGFSTVSLTGITENIMFKAMLEQYNAFPTTIPDVAYETDTNDFKVFKRYRLTADGDFGQVGADGELKSMGLQDESYQNQVQTRGVLMVLTRTDIINDDMGALTQAPTVIGRKAAINREKQFYTVFLSGLTTTAPGASIGKPANAFNFFSTGAGNYLSGAGSVLGIGGVTTARTQFLQQVDKNGDPIFVMPDRLLVPPELLDAANNLYNGTNIVVNALGSTSAKGTEVNWNAHKGNYRPIVTPFLGGKSPLSGASATQWAMLANPAGGMATVQVGYLRGQRTPIIKQVETPPNILGIGYQAIYDWGMALHDYRCGQYSAGV